MPACITKRLNRMKYARISQTNGSLILRIFLSRIDDAIYGKGRGAERELPDKGKKPITEVAVKQPCAAGAMPVPDRVR
jgi:hypothetical protein